MAASASTSRVSLKLLINTETKKVLFAEAGKDFVDILSVPVADIITHVRKHGMVGSLANLYESVENLNETYLQSSHTKNTLLKPPSVVSLLSKGFPLPANISAAPARRDLYNCNSSCRKYVSDDPRAICPNCMQKMTTEMSYVGALEEKVVDFGIHSFGTVTSLKTALEAKINVATRFSGIQAAAHKKFYRCNNFNCHKTVSSDPFATCPHCNGRLPYEMSYVASPAEEKLVFDADEGGGFVKGAVTFMVMDDLVVTPMSTISSITILNKFNVKEVGVLEEKLVHLGMNEALKLLKAALETKNVLTSVFLNDAATAE